MALQIIKQSDGKYCVWSTSVDDFVLSDAERKDIVAFYLNREHASIVKRVNEVCNALDKGDSPPYQIPKTYDDCMQFLKEKKESNG